ncbi:MAG: M3 family oligoendopeptidase [Anaerolineae bacterium]|nr:M3 family oligoendopeptidase [Anaerolineae bacterium]
MFNTLPQSAQEFMKWNWAQIEPYFLDLESRELNAANVDAWLADWSRLTDLLSEANSRLFIATTLDTADKAAEKRFIDYLEQIIEPHEPHEQKLREKLLASGLEPEGFEVPLRAIRADVALFREANIPLFTQEKKLSNEYEAVIGAQAVIWEGEERTLPRMRPLYQNADRAVREKAMRLVLERQFADREKINSYWQQLFGIRAQQAANAGFSDYRTFRWQVMGRFDYTPEDCQQFRDAIEQTVVPAAVRIYERRRQHLGYDTLRPWDLDVDPLGREPLRPFTVVADLESKTEAIFRRVDPQLGEHFATMRRENLLDLENRKGKAAGGYQEDLAAIKRPFIFMNAVGLQDDVQTMLHEGGHAFHTFESIGLLYNAQRHFGAEIAEVASMAMELLAAPYLAESEGGFYSEADAARARIEKLEEMILFWPYMAVVDGFQHWVYTHAADATDPAKCDAAWGELWGRFMKGVDWSGLDDFRVTGWQRKMHIFSDPFYYVDYGLAQMGAVQIWKSALNDQTAAVKQYRAGLALGGTRTLPELYAATGARFAFDAGTLGELIVLIEQTLEALEAKT